MPFTNLRTKITRKILKIEMPWFEIVIVVLIHTKIYTMCCHLSFIVKTYKTLLEKAFSIATLSVVRGHL